MNSLIQDLVDMARAESGQLTLNLTAIDLPPFVRELRRSDGRGPKSATRARPGGGAGRTPSALANPDRLERILSNLLGHALKYSPPSSPVVVTVSRRDGELVVAVRDQGRGIPAEELPHLFERYYRAREARGHRRGSWPRPVHHEAPGGSPRGAHLGRERAREGEQVQLQPARRQPDTAFTVDGDRLRGHPIQAAREDSDQHGNVGSW